MFSEMVSDLSRGKLPEPVSLRKRFDAAITKKLGIVRLPRTFWMNDPKINPRSDHLFWAALLLKDRQRIDLVLAVIAAEIAEEGQADSTQDLLATRVSALLDLFFARLGDRTLCRRIRHELQHIVPEWVDRNTGPDQCLT